MAMDSKRPQQEPTTAPDGTVVIITTTNDTNWAEEIFSYMREEDVNRAFEATSGYPASREDWDDIEDYERHDAIWDEIKDDAFDGGRTTFGYHFFVVSVTPVDGSEYDAFVCASKALAQTVKDEIIAQHPNPKLMPKEAK